MPSIEFPYNSNTRDILSLPRQDSTVREEQYETRVAQHYVYPDEGLINGGALKNEEINNKRNKEKRKKNKKEKGGEKNSNYHVPTI